MSVFKDYLGFEIVDWVTMKVNRAPSLVYSLSIFHAVGMSKLYQNIACGKKSKFQRRLHQGLINRKRILERSWGSSAMGIQFSIQKIPVHIRHFRAHDFARNFSLYLMTHSNAVLLITRFLCLSLLSLILAPARRPSLPSEAAS